MIVRLLIIFAVILAASPSNASTCEKLWTERNEIYKAAGYCFKSARAISTFGNAGCKFDTVNEVPLSENERALVAQLAKQEQLQACSNFDAPTRAAIQFRCRVMDPTGTPLNVRSLPQGSVVGALRNGTLVTVLDQSNDSDGRSWAYVGQIPNALPIGWVYREFISCF